MNPHSTVYSLRRRACAALLVPALGLGTAVVAAPVAGADEAVTTAGAAAATEIATVPGDADFFALPDATDTAAADLASLAPGTPLKQRSVPARINNLGDMPVTMTQVQYRTTTVTGEPTVAVTSVLQPPVGVQRTGDTVMYASFYDSMNPEDGPSRVLVRGAQSGMLDYAEAAFVTPLLAAGHTVVMPDIQGERGVFAVGREYGQIILDGLRASRDTPAAGVAADSKTALTGYSGGSIGTGWAGIIADDYAPDIARNIVGVAEGGVMVRPEHNLAYAGEGAKWSGVVGMALTGMAAAYGDDLSPYLTDLGKKVVAQMVGVKIDDAENTYDHLRWEELFRPEYPTPDDVPPIRAVLDDTNMGLAPVPSYPYYIGQSGGGADQQKTPVHPTLGDGDGVMLLGDTRGLAQYYCDAGTTVQYEEYPPIGHTYAGPYWATQMVPWVNARFAGQAAPSTCGSVPAGNSLTD